MLQLTFVVTLLIIPSILTFAHNTYFANAYKIEEKGNNPYIVVSIPSLATIVKEVVGNITKVDTILPEGVDPHSYSLTVKDIEKIRNADILILADKEHLTLEQQILENAPGKIYFDFENYTQYGAYMISIPGFEKNFHGYWLYPDNARAIAVTIAQKLEELYPNYSEIIQNNLNVFKSKLNLFLSNLEKFVNKYQLNGTHVAIAVPGIAYIAKMFGFTIRALFVKGPNRFINATELAEVERLIENGTIKYILCEEILREGKPGQIAQQISEDTGALVIYVTAFSMSNIQDYVALLTYNVGVIKASLEHTDSQGSIFDAILAYITIGVISLIALIEGFLIFRIRRSVEE